MTGVVGPLTERGSAFNGGLTPLRDARGIATVERGGETIVYVAAVVDDSITALRLTPAGLLQPFPAGTTSLSPQTSTVTALRVIEVDGTEFLIVGTAVAGISSFRIEANGALTPIDNVLDTPVLEISGIFGVMSSLEVAGDTLVFVPGRADDGVSVFRVDAIGNFINLDNVDDADNLLNALDNPYQVLAFRAHGTDFLATTGINENAVSLFTISAAGALTPVSRIPDNGILALGGPVAALTASLGGFTYLFVSSIDEDAITTLAVSPTGQLNVVTETNEPTILDGVSVMSLLEIGGVPFIVAVAEQSDTVSVWGIGTDGVLSLVTSFTDTASTAFDLPGGVATVEVDGRFYVLATGLLDDGITALELGPNSDVLVGDAGNNALFGLAGGDTLVGERGRDTLTGGDGNDVLLGGLQDDRLFGGQGNDLLAAEGGADTLAGGAGLDTLVGGAGADSMRGEADNDQMLGGGGADTAVGGDGDDTIFGGDGVDSLVGSDGDDRLNGNGSNDTIYGSAGDDHLYGADGRDLLGGGPGEDTLFGADGSDTLNGGGDRDRLVGGAGFDQYRTGLGADIVVFKDGDGRDRIVDFQNNVDRIDLTDFEFANFGAVNALASTFGSAIIIEFGGGDDLIIQNFTLGQFNAADVIL